MGVDSLGKGGMADVVEMSPGQDQRSKTFKDKGRKPAPPVTTGGLLRTSSAGLLGEGDKDLQKDVVAHLRNSGNSKDGGNVTGKNQNSSLEKLDDSKKKTSAGNVRVTGMPAGFSFNATHIIRGPDSDSLDCESNYETSSVASVDLRTRGGHRSMLGSHSKPTPSKWDDAEPWLPVLAASETPTRPKAKSGPLQAHIVASQYPALLQKRGAFANALGRQHAAVNGVLKLAPLSSGSHSVTSGSSDAQSSGDDLTTTGEDSGQSSDQPPRPSFERTKKVDTKYSTSQGDSGVKFSFMPVTGPTPRENTVDRYPLNDVSARGRASKLQETSLSSESNDESFSKPTLRTEKPTSDGCLEVEGQADSSTYDSPAVTVRSVCMRDMGTEMTPIASQEPSRTGTPLAATTPTLGSPSSSRPATPHRFGSKSSSSTQNSAVSGQSVADGESKASDLSEKELQVRTRQEILALGAQLGKANVAAWAPKVAEQAHSNNDPSVYNVDEMRKNRLQSRAAVWEEAERAKYLARYTREESRIQAWENHQKAKAEADLRRVEVEIERVRSRANEKLMCKLAATRRQAEDMRAAAEARRAEQAAQIAESAERIRRTGKVPGSIFPGLCCT